LKKLIFITFLFLTCLPQTFFAKSVEVNGENIVFLRGENYYQHLMKKVRNADTEILITTFSASSDRIDAMERFYKALSKQANEGVDVRLFLAGVLDKSKKLKKKLDQYRFNLKLNQKDTVQHMKFILIDGEHVYNGSGNLTMTAFSRMYETTVYFENDRLYKKFREKFFDIWESK